MTPGLGGLAFFSCQGSHLRSIDGDIVAGRQIPWIGKTRSDRIAKLSLETATRMRHPAADKDGVNDVMTFLI